MIRKTVVGLLLLLMLITSVNIGCVGKYTNPSATLARMSGEVLLKKAGTGSWVRASSGTSLEIGDCIKTQTNSSAVIAFFEGSISEVGAETEICIKDLSVFGDTGSTSVKLHQEIGNTSNRVEKLVDPASRYEIETPDGVALVRGSVMSVMVLKGMTIVDAIKGECWAIGEGKEVLLTEGTRSTMRKGQAPSPAVSPAVQAPSPPPVSAPPPLPSQDMDMMMVKSQPQLCPPTVETGDASTGKSQATLYGELTSMGTAPVVQVSFEWGTTSGGPYPNETTPQSMNTTGSYTAIIDGLVSGVTYYYKAKGNGGFHGVGYGAEERFSLGR